MISLPIAQREMQVLAKSRGLYRSRVIASVVVLVFGCGIAALYHHTGAGTTRQIFQTIGAGIFIMCIVAGSQATSDAITAEKRNGTLGLLLLTLQRPWEIALGKLVAHGLLAFYGVLLLFPLMSLTMILGGVHWSELLRVGLAILNTLFLAASAGLLASAAMRTRQRANTVGMGLILVFWFGIPGLLFVARERAVAPWIEEVLVLINLSEMMTNAFAGRATAKAFWIPLAVTHLTGWCFFGLAAYCLPRYWHEFSQRDDGLTWRQRLRQTAFGRGPARARRRRALLERNAFLWLSSRNRILPALIVCLTGGLYLALGWMFTADGSKTMLHPAVLGGLTVAFGFMHRLLFSGAAVVRMVEEQEQGTLELIVSTPLSASELMKGQTLAMWRLFRGAILLVSAGTIGAGAGLLASRGISGGWSDSEMVLLLLVAAAYVIYLADLAALSFLGLWTPLTCKHLKNAGSTALASCLLPPGIALLLLLITTAWGGGAGQISVEIFIVIWAVLALATDCFWIVVIRRGLAGKIREMAYMRYSRPAAESLGG